MLPPKNEVKLIIKTNPCRKKSKASIHITVLKAYDFLRNLSV